MIRQTAGVPSVRALAEALGASARTVGDGPGWDAEVTEFVVVGPGEALPSHGRAVVVAIGAPVVPPEAAPLAVIVKAADSGGLQAAAWPVVVVDDALPLNHLLHLLGTVMEGAAVTTSVTGDLFALADTVAAMVGGAVSVEDPQRAVVAYSSLPGQRIDAARQAGILGRQVPDRARNDHDYRELVRRRAVLRTPQDGDLLPRLAVAVRSGPEVLGFLWVVEGEEMPEDAEARLIEAADLAAVHLLRARAGRSVERRSRGDVVRQLLDGTLGPDAAGVRLGVDPGQPVALLALAVPAEVAEREVDAQAVADLVLALCAATSPRSAVLLTLRTAYALVPAEGVSRAQLLELAAATCRRARQALGVDLTASVGRTVVGLHDLAASRADADAVLRVVPTGSVAAVEEVQPAVALGDLRVEVARNPHLRLPAVEALLAHDRDHDTPYAQTVLAYLAAQHDVVAASAAISIHQNTFRYRLRRARELFDLDLEDPDVRLLTWLRLRTADQPPSTSA